MSQPPDSFHRFLTHPVALYPPVKRKPPRASRYICSSCVRLIHLSNFVEPMRVQDALAPSLGAADHTRTIIFSSCLKRRFAAGGPTGHITKGHFLSCRTSMQAYASLLQETCMPFVAQTLIGAFARTEAYLGKMNRPKRHYPGVRCDDESRGHGCPGH